MVTPILMTIEFRTYKLAMADAEIDLGSYSGSDLEQTEGGEGGSPQKANGVKGHKRFGSVRALAIKKGVLTHEVDEGSPCLKCGDKCPGFSLHFWRKVCKNCLCQREEHDIREDAEEEDVGVHVGKLLFSPTVDTLKRNTGSKKIQLPTGNEMAPSPRLRRSIGEVANTYSPSTIRRNEKYLWIPSNCNFDTTRAYFEALPSSKAPIRGTPGERYRQKQLIRQVPAHDIDMLYCNNLSLEEKKQMEIFLRMRKEKSLGKGLIKRKELEDKASDWTCEKCKLALNIGQVAVFTERAGPAACWHPACFTCVNCCELLVDLIYFYHEKDGQLYCGRHHAEKIKPRCAACDELIFCHEYTHAEDSNWHLDHFCCLRCDVGLGGKQYRAQDGMPYCLACYETSFSTVCETCGESIGLNEPRLAHGDSVWHGTETCFHCVECKKSLIDQPFLPKYGKVFCSKDHARHYKTKLKKH